MAMVRSLVCCVLAFVDAKASFVCLSFFDLERDETMGKLRVLWVDDVLSKAAINDDRCSMVRYLRA